MTIVPLAVFLKEHRKRVYSDFFFVKLPFHSAFSLMLISNAP